MVLTKGHSVAERTTLLQLPFCPDQTVDLDDIVPYTDLSPGAALEILATRKIIGELMFAREEDMVIADVADAEADGQETRLADASRPLQPHQRAMLAAQAKRNRILARRHIWRARHRELEILAHLSRKDGGLKKVGN